jgi:hypothetical protein
VDFLALQNAVMSRLNLSTSDARSLVKGFLNLRYRQVQSSIGLAPTRRGVLTFNTVIGQRSVALPVAKLTNIVDRAILRRPLVEVTLDQLRALDPAELVVGPPTHYAIHKHEQDEVTILLYPTPTSVSALHADALLPGTDMSADADEPTFPADFHDVLVYGAVADSLRKLEKWKPADAEETRFASRLSDLRYFLVKSAYLSRSPRDRAGDIYGRRPRPNDTLAV